jgi:hypothetical protein
MDFLRKPSHDFAQILVKAVLGDGAFPIFVLEALEAADASLGSLAGQLNEFSLDALFRKLCQNQVEKYSGVPVFPTAPVKNNDFHECFLPIPQPLPPGEENFLRCRV